MLPGDLGSIFFESHILKSRLGPGGSLFEIMPGGPGACFVAFMPVGRGVFLNEFTPWGSTSFLEFAPLGCFCSVEDTLGGSGVWFIEITPRRDVKRKTLGPPGVISKEKAPAQRREFRNRKAEPQGVN